MSERAIQAQSLLISQKPNLERLFKQKSISKTEKAYLDGLQVELGIPIVRQVKFPRNGGFILLDGALLGFNVALEYDGPQNHESEAHQAKDKYRDEFLVKKGYNIYRLQWFKFEKELYHPILQEEIKVAARAVKALINWKIIQTAQLKRAKDLNQLNPANIKSNPCRYEGCNAPVYEGYEVRSAGHTQPYDYDRTFK